MHFDVELRNKSGEKLFVKILRIKNRNNHFTYAIYSEVVIINETGLALSYRARKKGGLISSQWENIGKTDKSVSLLSNEFVQFRILVRVSRNEIGRSEPLST